jgi:hypothetical protein
MLISHNLTLHIICLSEHYITEQNLLLINMEGYHLASNFSRNNHAGGGV